MRQRSVLSMSLVVLSLWIGALPVQAVRVNNVNSILLPSNSLEKACMLGDINTVASLFPDNKKNLGEKGARLRLLEFAIASKKIELVHYLIEHDCNINESDPDTGLQIIHQAVSCDTVMLSYLISRGANVNAEAGAFGTPLNVAVYECNKTAAALLLEHQADTERMATISVCDDNGKVVKRNRMTPLILAVASHNIDMIELLVANHANIKAVLQSAPLPADTSKYPVGPVMSSPRSAEIVDGDSCLDIARKNGDEEILKYLKKHAGRR